MAHKHSHRFEDLTSKTFGRWTVLKFDSVKSNNSYWICKCACGKIVSVRRGDLISGRSTSCGCFRYEILTKGPITHGMSRTTFYMVWFNIKRRCLDPKTENYTDYGGRGIIVCDRWLKFENFCDDMYPSYLKHVEEFDKKDTTIERINVNGNYEPTNCKWATRKEQNRNTRNTAISKEYDKHMKWRDKLTIALSNSISRNRKLSKCLVSYLGCTLQQFKQYLESKFNYGMTWENHGSGVGKWELDHIVSCNNFDLSKEEDRKNCFYYTNFQPLWWEDHKKKSNTRKKLNV